MTPEEIYARLLYRDGMMLVLDKPAGLPVHRGPKGGENFEQSFGHLRFGLPRDPGSPIGWTGTPRAACCSGAIARLWKS